MNIIDKGYTRCIWSVTAYALGCFALTNLRWLPAYTLQGGTLPCMMLHYVNGIVKHHVNGSTSLPPCDMELKRPQSGTSRPLAAHVCMPVNARCFV